MFKSKKIILVIAIISLIVTICNLIYAFLNNVFVNYLQIASIVPIFTVIYSESASVYKIFNQIIASLFGKTIGFESEYTFFTDEDIEENYFDLVQNYLETQKYKLKGNTIKKLDDDKDVIFSAEDKSGVKSDYLLNKTYDTDAMAMRVTLSVSIQLSYKDLKKAWTNYRSLLSGAFSHISKIQNKQHYSLSIFASTTTSFKPFYRLIVKNIDPKNIDLFVLKYKDNEMKITTTSNKIYATSKNIDDMNRIIAELIPLTHLF